MTMVGTSCAKAQYRASFLFVLGKNIKSSLKHLNTFQRLWILFSFSLLSKNLKQCFFFQTPFLEIGLLMIFRTLFRCKSHYLCSFSIFSIPVPFSNFHNQNFTKIYTPILVVSYNSPHQMVAAQVCSRIFLWISSRLFTIYVCFVTCCAVRTFTGLSHGRPLSREKIRPANKELSI